MTEKSSTPSSPESEPETKGQKDTDPTEKGQGYYSGVDEPDVTTDDVGT